MKLPTTDPRFPNENQLGKLKSVHACNGGCSGILARVAMFVFGASCVLGSLGLLALVFPASASCPSSLVLLLIGLVAAWMDSRNVSRQVGGVALYERGLVSTLGSDLQEVRWDQVEAVAPMLFRDRSGLLSRPASEIRLFPYDEPPVPLAGWLDQAAVLWRAVLENVPGIPGEDASAIRELIDAAPLEQPGDFQWADTSQGSEA